MTYTVRNTGSGDYKRIHDGIDDVATILRLSNKKWGIYSLSEKKLTNVTFDTPERAKTFYANNLVGKV